MDIIPKAEQKKIEKAMKESIPSTKEMLQKILLYLSTYNGAAPDEHIANNFRFANISHLNIKQCTTQLINDGFAGMVMNDEIRFANHKIILGDMEGSITKAINYVPGYYITLEGLKFLDWGGYTSWCAAIIRWLSQSWFNALSVLLGIMGVYLTLTSINDKNEIKNLNERINRVETHANSQTLLSQQNLQNQLNIVHSQVTAIQPQINILQSELKTMKKVSGKKK